MPVTVDLLDLEMAIECVSEAHEVDAYVSRSTGRVYIVGLEGGEDEDLPDDIDDPDLIPFPHKPDLDLGRGLVRRFAVDVAPHLRGEIDACFDRKGAYARLKDLLARANLLDRWHRYERDNTLAAIEAWAEEQGFVVIPPGSPRQGA